MMVPPHLHAQRTVLSDLNDIVNRPLVLQRLYVQSVLVIQIIEHSSL
jgi:hypothetical protein